MGENVEFFVFAVANSRFLYTFAREIRTNNYQMKTFILTMAALLMWAADVRANDFETAKEAVANMGVGWNLGNTLDANSSSASGLSSETCWGQPTTKAELMTMMKKAGYSAVRVPVTWYNHMDSSGNVDADWMARVKEVVDYVIDAGLYCILNVHHDTGSGDGAWLEADETVYSSVKSKYESLWNQIATTFKDYDEKLLFEAYNEMLDTYDSWCFASFATSNRYDATVATSAYNAINSYAQTFCDVVRATGGNNAQRNLVVNTYAACSGSGTWNSHLKEPLQNMKVPSGEGDHIIFEVHAYPTISPLSEAKTTFDNMMTALNQYLVAQGVPVIFGEWGTSDSSSDYTNNKDTMFEFVDYFVSQAKANNMATFFWMGLSDGSARSLPAFNQADLAERIVNAYYGETTGYEYPSTADIETNYQVTYNAQWSEVNVHNGSLSLSEYVGIRVELDQSYPSDMIKLKAYGENSSEQYAASTGNTRSMTFSTSKLGSTVSRVTLQCFSTGSYTGTIKKIYLLKSDGTEVEVTTAPSTFWGCTVEAVSATSGIHEMTTTTKTAVGNTGTYSITGQKVADGYKGIVIKNGRKYLVK